MPALPSRTRTLIQVMHTARPRGAAAAALPASLLALLLAACSTPGIKPEAPGAVSSGTVPAAVPAPETAAARDALNRMVTLQDRLYRVAAPLLINNADLCRSQARNLLGFTAKNKYSYPGEYTQAAQDALGYGERLQVSGVLAGSGAARAGLRKGDGLIAAEDKALPTGPNAETLASGILGPLVTGRASLNLSIERHGASQTLRVPVTRACAFRVELGNSDNINSYADGQRVLVTRGMINFAQNDESIAYVLAKGMAHNILGHAALQRNTGTVGGIIDALSNTHPDLSMLIGSGGIKPMPQELDAAADRLSLYLLARAGYGIDNAPHFWQRLATQYPVTVLNGYTANHPATAFRVAAINRASGEVKGLQKAKKPLVP
jgi:hypothetical protein